MIPHRVATFPWISINPWLRYGAAVVSALAAVFGGWLIPHDKSIWPMLLFIGLFGFGALLAATVRQTHINMTIHTVTSEGRLFGRIQLWRTVRFLNEFSAVIVYRSHDREGGDTFFVGLQPKVGRLVLIQTFGANREAAVFSAQQLAQVANLPVTPGK